MAQQLTDSTANDRGRSLVAVLEAQPSELHGLLQAHDATPIAIPAVTQALYDELEAVRCLIDELASGKYQLALFMSGGAVSALFECAHELGRRADLVSALRELPIACRGPKATAALRRFGLYAKPGTSAPLTASSLTRSLQKLELAGRGVLRFNGEREDALAKALRAHGANLREISLVQRRSPKDTVAAEALLRTIVSGGLSALVVSCELQFLHLYQIARRLELVREFVSALRKQVVVAVVGTPARDAVEAYGVRPHLLPAQPQMLVMALMNFLDTRAGVLRAAIGKSPLPS
ncbi:MAG TPA: uroporphyrinogen-III synthase [Polyangiaceae bacterium]|nr:uroporphyrinogen-III synthase [Polyangiaceae bacterium]